MRIQLVQSLIDKIRGKKIIMEGCVSELPLPHHMKMDIVKNCFAENECKIFIETGTYLGDTTAILSKVAKKVYTIELSKDLYNKAVERFKNTKNVKCLQGDSKDIFPLLLKEIDEKPLFWLDGHYSGGFTAQGEKDTPINEELDNIKQSGIKHAVILIDDARLFGVDKDYPSIDELKNKIFALWTDASFENKDDIIRVIIK